MRDEGLDEDEHGNLIIINPDHDGGIRTAVDAWFADPAAAKAKYGPIASWDVSEVTDLDQLFEGREDFNEDISRWNVGRVKSMEYMFSDATSFNGDLSRWDVGQAKNMEYMFRDATSFNGDLSSWEVGQVKNMDIMFNGATSFTHQLGGAWSTSTATRTAMFGRGCPGSIT